MQCPNCKLENPEAAIQCLVCRQPLAAARADHADGIWLIPPPPAVASPAGAVPDSMIAAPDDEQQAAPPQHERPAAKTADKWLPRLVFFLGIFIVGVGLGLSGSNWFTLSGHAPSGADGAAAEKADSGPHRVVPRSSATAVPADAAGRNDRPDQASATAKADTGATAQSPVAIPAPAVAPAPLPAPVPTPEVVPAVPKLKPASAAPSKPASAELAAKHRRAARHKNAESGASLAASAASVRPPAATRPHRLVARKKPASPREAPAAGSLQIAEMKSGSKRFLLNQCESLPSWIEREKCRWQICSNQWGQHGCPAYPSTLNQQ